MKPWKQGRQRTRLKDWLLTGPGAGVSRMPYAPEGETGNDDDDDDGVIVLARKQDLLLCQVYKKYLKLTVITVMW
jgi:hypothetical protein